jgi:hypothetical protein
LLTLAAEFFDRNNIAYALTGSQASIAYGEQRFTADIDVVVKLDQRKLAAILASFPSPEFYVSEVAATNAVTNGGQFNIIHPDSGQKIDVIVPRDPAWPDDFVRRRQMLLENHVRVWFVSPEDLILRKMGFFQEGGSEKHLRDIASMLRISGKAIDREYIDQWAAALGLEGIWTRIRTIDE